jgi:hypothetical protein
MQYKNYSTNAFWLPEPPKDIVEGVSFMTNIKVECFDTVGGLAELLLNLGVVHGKKGEFISDEDNQTNQLIRQTMPILHALDALTLSTKISRLNLEEDFAEEEITPEMHRQILENAEHGKKAIEDMLLTKVLIFV